MGLAAAWLCFAAPPATAATTFETQPPGSHLDIRGPISLTGMAPVTAAALPAGDYELTARGPGSALTRGRFRLDSGGLTERSWAGLASLLQPPGLVHLERGEKRGWFFLGAAAGSGVMAGMSQSSLGDGENDRKKAQAIYDRAVSDDEIFEARTDLEAAAREEDDAREVRNLWLGYLAGTWLLSGVESMLLTPQPTFTRKASGRYVVGLPGAGGMKAALLSVVVPGAGQRYVGRNGPANLFLGATATLAAGSIAAHDSFLSARRKEMKAQRVYDHAETPEEVQAARRSLQRAADRADHRNLVRWAFFGAASGVYVWNVLDAFGAGRGDHSPELAWSVYPIDGGVRSAATWSFR